MPPRHSRPLGWRFGRILFWTAPRRFWPRWMEVLILEAGDRARLASCGLPALLALRSRGRRIGAEVFEIVRRVARENPSGGAPRIHGEPLKPGFDISERAVTRYLARRLPRPGDGAENWRVCGADGRPHSDRRPLCIDAVFFLILEP